LGCVVRSIDLLHRITSGRVQRKGLKVCTQTPKIGLGMPAQLIDTTKAAVLQTCILTVWLAQPPLFCLSTSILVPDTTFVKH
ncbi:hypothetical protein, partial [Microcoleus sp. herbarium12]|uniref:hypothetical protein n=1 Tax=Microcoleus sp. herbarium12 TaxID=3055437 RepID=UPI002FD74C6C